MNEEDPGALFRRTVGKVRRVEHDGIEPVRPRPSPRVRRQEPWQDPPADDAFVADAGPPTSGGGTEYVRAGLQRSVLRKLRRGQYPIVDELDLHGLTTREAHRRLGQFLEVARSDRVICVRVITGKGLSSPGMSPVLKPKVSGWLRHDERVLAFTTARPADGGSGALCVLLRSRRD